ncbi:MAG: ABC transporter substrate-binding protein [Candidatus Taylorbacteria bacterium]
MKQTSSTVTNQSPKELGFKKGPTIMSYFRQFSATEKVIFGVFVLTVIITTIIMAQKVNNLFMVEIPGRGGTLHEGIVGLPRNINPILAITDVDRDISSLVYSGLLKWENAKLVPDIATSYKVSDDGLTYTFILNDNVRFHDGTQLTSDDVAFTVQKIQDATLKSPRKSDWTNVTVQTISPVEIHFVLKQAYAPFITNMTLGILPKHIWNTVNDDQFIFNHYNINPVGSGPYKVANIVNDGSGIPTDYELSTWSGYYGKIPYISNIDFTFFADEEKAVIALENGAIDSLATVSSNEAAKLAADKSSDYTVLESTLPRIFGVFFNQNQAPVLADKIVRQALDMSVDRTAIIKKVLSGYGVPIDKPLPSNITAPLNNHAQLGAVAASQGTSTLVKTGNIAGAQALLEKNGWRKDLTSGIYTKKDKKNVTLTISFDIFTADTPDLKQAAEMVKNSWTEMGAQVDLRVFNASDLYQNVIRTRKYDALLFGELIGKDRDLYAFWHSSQIKAPGLNVALYANSKVDKLLEDIRATNDDDVRLAKYTQFNDFITTDIPAVFLYSPDFIYVVPKSLRGIDLEDITVSSDRWNSESTWYLITENVWKFFSGR